jgi:hypothetical protein
LAFTLAAFAFRSFVLQTHVHFGTALQVAQNESPAALKSPAQAVKQLAQNSTRQGKDSPIDDPAKCPLCQEYLYAGNYIAPAGIAVLPPAQTVSTIALETRVLRPVWAISHSWQGRAPPAA